MNSMNHQKDGPSTWNFYDEHKVLSNFACFLFGTKKWLPLEVQLAGFGSSWPEPKTYLLVW